jgi:stage V sporulation protein D (sporulation-specific penicillin-binding protein)
MGRNRQEAKRLRVIFTWIAIIFLLIIVRLSYLQIIKHNSYLTVAENQWSKSITLPADRGTIYDRNGKTLARSVTRWRLGLATRQISDTSLLIKSLSKYIVVPDNLKKRIIQADGKHIVIASKVVLHPDEVKQIRSIKGLTMEEQRSRIYPYGGTGASLLGFSKQDADGRYHCAGIESSLNNTLAGSMGIGSKIVRADGSDYGYEIIKEPIDGESVTLAIDIEIQTICENLLQKYITECNAKGGSVIVVNPLTGDILAAADAPIVRTRGSCPDSLNLWDNYNFTGAYEPGSVFKIFTTASLLSHSAVNQETVYDCDDGDFGKYKIRNSSGHDPFGQQALLYAFAHSINIYFARAVENVSKKEFYRDVRSFGFGLPTGIQYPGASTGLLSDHSKWSGRSKPTIAIGQELLVSPLQAITAGTVIANQGKMVKTRLIKHIGQEVDTKISSKSVISKTEAQVVKECMVEAVKNGTGTRAQVKWTSVAGKTGTAQKSIPGIKGYAPGKYIASFLGFAPVENPKVIILTIIDEPDYAHHYASNSAAPLFAGIVNEMGRSTEWFDGIGNSVIASGSNKSIIVPDLKFMTAVTARQKIESLGLTVKKNNSKGLVVAQYPAPGTRVAEDNPIAITVAIEGQDDSFIIPELKGMSNREIMQYAKYLQIKVNIHGTGYVKRQKPLPGQILKGGELEIWMEEIW